jgi:hypothetical protein
MAATATVQIGKKQPFSVTNQNESSESLVTVTMYPRGNSGTLTPINTGTAVLNIQSAEFSTFGDMTTSKGMAGNTGNCIISDEGLDLRLTVIPEGSTLNNVSSTGALASASCPAIGSWCKIADAPVIGFGPFAASANSSAGAFNSSSWMVQKASVRWQAGDRWGIDLELKQYVSSDMRCAATLS